MFDTKRNFIISWSAWVSSMILQVISDHCSKPLNIYLEVISWIMLGIFIVLILKGAWRSYRKHKIDMKQLDEDYRKLLEDLNRISLGSPPIPSIKKEVSSAALNKASRERMK